MNRKVDKGNRLYCLVLDVLSLDGTSLNHLGEMLSAADQIDRQNVDCWESDVLWNVHRLQRHNMPGCSSKSMSNAFKTSQSHSK